MQEVAGFLEKGETDYVNLRGGCVLCIKYIYWNWIGHHGELKENYYGLGI